MTDVPDGGRRPLAGERASHLVCSNGLWHHVLEYGEGDRPLVLIPGITAAAATWGFVAQALPRFRVLVVDVRGRGLSDHPGDGFALDDYAADLAGIVTGLRLDAPLLAGHSMGARIAAALDVAQPGLAAGLVLIDPPLSGPGRPPYPMPLELYRRLLELAQADPPAVAALRALEPGLPSDAAAAERLRWLRSCDPHAVAETLRGFHDEDFHDLYERLTAPAVLVRGAESDVVTASGADELRALRPDIPVVDVPGAGHLVAHDNLAALCAAIEAFDASLDHVDDH